MKMSAHPAIANVKKPCRIRATAVSMAFPAVEVSSGRNGEPVCPAPYTEPWSASRTTCQRAELSLAAHGPVQAATCWSNRASAVSNCAKNAESVPRAPSAFSTSGFAPRLAPRLESWSEARVATRTIGTMRLTERRSVRPTSPRMG